MAESRDDQRKVIEKEKAQDAIIVDETKKAIDIYDLLSDNRDDPVVIKINRLMQVGQISDTMVAEKYKEKAGSIANKDLALTVLDSVFIELALNVSKQPNGIVIDLTTGLKDEKLSDEQARALGLSESESLVNTMTREEIVQKSIEKSIEKYRKDKESKREQIYSLRSISSERSPLFDKALLDYSKGRWKDDDDAKTRNDIKNFGASKEAEDEMVKARKRLVETDPKLMRLIELANNANKFKGSPRFNIVIKDLSNFLNENPDYSQMYSEIINENREVKKDYKEMLKTYHDDISKWYLIDRTKNLEPMDIEYFTSKEKKDIMLGLVASIRSMGKDSVLKNSIVGKLKMIFPDIEEVFPKEGTYDKNKLFEFVEKNLELDEPLTPKKFKKLVETSQEYVLSKTNNQELVQNYEKQQNNKTNDNRITEAELTNLFARSSEQIDVDMNAILRNNGKETDEQKYFKNSENIEFTKNDERNIKRTYDNFNAFSWISDKKDAEELNFLSLIKLKESLSEIENKDEYHSRKLQNVESKIEEIKNKNKDVDFDKYFKEDGKLTREASKKITSYGKSKILEKMLYDYLVDESQVNNYEDYDKLPKKEKQEYLLNTISSFTYNKKNTLNTIGKFTARRLEVISTDENKFVSYGKNEDGQTTVSYDKEKILNEYNRISSHKFNSYEELEQYCDLKKSEYINMKLEEYSNLREEDFFKLTGETNTEKSREIEQYRLEFNSRVNYPPKESSAFGEENSKNNSNGEEKNFRDNFVEENDRETNALVEVGKPSFFDRIKNAISNISEKIKNAFSGNKENQETFEEQEDKNSNSQDVFYHVDVDVNQAVKATYRNNENEKENQNNRLNDAVSVEDEGVR